MPQGRYDPRLKSLLEQKYGKSLPDELFQTDNSELSGARDRYKERAQTGNDLAFMSKAASRMGQLGGQRSESMYDPATVKGISQGAGLDLGAAKEDYSDRDKVRKYVADKYLTPQKEGASDWQSTGKRSKSGKLLLMNKRTGETREGPELGTDPDKEKLKAPGSGDIARADNIQGAADALDDMNAALNEMGSNRFLSKFNEMTTIGDTPFEEANRRWGEMLGRMQSGGAIQKDEQANFMSMAPKIGDSPEMRSKKVETLKRILSERMAAMKAAKDMPTYRDISAAPRAVRDKYGYEMGQTKTGADGVEYKYVGNNEWEQLDAGR